MAVWKTLRADKALGREGTDIRLVHSRFRPHERTSWGSDQPPSDAPSVKQTVIEQEILDFSADEFDLLACPVCAHHGKVRMTWYASPANQKANDRQLRIRGVPTGDLLLSLRL